MYCSSVGVDDEFEKLVSRMNPPRVIIDNAFDEKTSLIKVDGANKRGSLLQMVQVLTDLNLQIRRAYISSDGGWFMDVFHVTDEFGNKVYDESICVKVQQCLGSRAYTFPTLERSVGVQSAAEHTMIELSGRDRPGLLSEIFAVLADHSCNIVAAEVWTHNSRMASVIYLTEKSSGLAINDSDRLNNIKHLLLCVLKGDREWSSSNSDVSVGSSQTQRRLHQMMYNDRDYDNQSGSGERVKPLVSVENFVEKGYTVVNLNSPDRARLLFDTVCTITDMQYVIFHGTIIAEGPEAQQEYFIRHMNGSPISSEAERQRVIQCLEAAIKRRSSEGIGLELCSEDRVGLLSDVTRIFRENGLSVVRAEVATRGTKAVNVFYVTDASGYQVKSETIEAVREQIGLAILRVKDDVSYSASPPSQQSDGFSFGSMFRSRSEKFLFNLGLIKSCS